MGTKKLNLVPMALWPNAMGTHFFQNGDPIFSEMVTKWGPSPASPGRYSFFVLNEYFFELNTGKNPVLNNIFELNFFGNSKMNIFLNWIFLINKVLNIFLNWIFLKIKFWIFFWIEYFWKFKFWIILWIEFLPKNKWMNKSLNQYLSFYIEWIKNFEWINKIFIVRKLTETKFSSWRAKPLWPKLGTSNLEIGTQQVLGFSWNMDQRETQTRN